MLVLRQRKCDVFHENGQSRIDCGTLVLYFALPKRIKQKSNGPGSNGRLEIFRCPPHIALLPISLLRPTLYEPYNWRPWMRRKPSVYDTAQMSGASLYLVCQLDNSCQYQNWCHRVHSIVYILVPSLVSFLHSLKTLLL